jgi:hypothetical protein
MEAKQSLINAILNGINASKQLINELERMTIAQLEFVFLTKDKYELY